MAQSNELRVFISSTFRDLQEEREHLVKKIFPEIRALCRTRGVAFTDIDLRWGLSEEDSMFGHVIRTCLEEIDRCRPFFIGIIGSRYGWIPEYHEVLMDPELIARFPFIEELALQGVSVTEMEFIHGVFSSSDVDGGSAFFYHRDSEDSQADHPDHLRSLIDRVRASGRPFRHFDDVESMGAMVRNDLMEMIDAHWPVSQIPSELELRRGAHSAFAASRIRAYIPTPTHTQIFNRWVEDGTLPLVIHGPSGLGKSSLVAYLVDSFRKKNRRAFVIEHYVGAGQNTGSSSAIMLHVIQEIRQRFDISDPIPLSESEITASFPNWLFRGQHLALQEDIDLLIAVDALNQMGEEGRRLAWLPRTIPPGIRLLLSTTPGECEDRLNERAWERLDVVPIDDERIRQSIVVRYLSEYHKTIPVELLRRVIADSKASSPLYLRVIAEELRLHGEYETIEALIARYIDTVDLFEVFQVMLERIEHDFDAATIGAFLSVIWASRSGLTEEELMDLVGLNRLTMSRLLFAFDYHFVRREGRLGYFHDYLRYAVEKRYLADEQTQLSMHRKVAAYFNIVVRNSVANGADVPSRTASELAYQLDCARDQNGLCELLSTIPVFVVLFQGETYYDVLRYWSKMRASVDVVDTYRRALSEWSEGTGAERARATYLVSDLLERLAHWSAAIELQRERLAAAVDLGETSEEASSRLRIGGLLRLQGEHQAALDELTRALDLFTELGDRQSASRAYGNMGGVYWARGEYDRAMECHQNDLAISEELGNRLGVSRAIYSMGMVHFRRSEYDRALECFQRQLNIAEELGDRAAIARAFSGIAVVYSARGENDQALECNERQLGIAEELGDRVATSNAIGNIGAVYADRGEYDRALSCFQRQLHIAEELGDLRDLAAATGRIGAVYDCRGEHDIALEYYHRQLTIAEQSGDRNGVSQTLGNMGAAHRDLGQHDRALECFERKLLIDEELGDRKGLSVAIGGLGTVYSARGEQARALECYERQMRISEEMGDRIGVATAIGNKGGAYEGQRLYDRAIESYLRATEEHRALGARYELTYWLLGIGRVILDLTHGDEPMPSYLPHYLPGSRVETWRATSLTYARKCAEECCSLSDELSKPDSQFAGRILLGRVEAAEGHVDIAVERFQTILAATIEDAQTAELHYWLWKVDASDHASTALALFQALEAKAPNHDYRNRIAELKRALMQS